MSLKAQNVRIEEANPSRLKNTCRKDNPGHGNCFTPPTLIFTLFEPKECLRVRYSIDSYSRFDGLVAATSQEVNAE